MHACIRHTLDLISPEFNYLPKVNFVKNMFVVVVAILTILCCLPIDASNKNLAAYEVGCYEGYFPENCDFNLIPLPTVEDYERCAPAKLSIPARNYYLGTGGRSVTFRKNMEALRRIQIKPKMLRDISRNSLEITTLGQKVSFPVGIAPSAFHLLADPRGENATAGAATAMGTIMILSSLSTISIAEVAESVRGLSPHLWMQLYVFKNRTLSVNIIRQAEKNGFKAIVVTVDASIFSNLTCNARHDPVIENVKNANVPGSSGVFDPDIITFKDIGWLKSITKLPIVVKGILRGDDARDAVLAGASAIYVSNHGGRASDSVTPTIEALSEVVAAVNQILPRRDVYMDSGVRNGFDVYKSLARGAKMVFVGRPALWGLAIEGEEGVKKVLQILKNEFNTTMLLAGASNPSEIKGDSISPRIPILV